MKKSQVASNQESSKKERFIRDLTNKDEKDLGVP